MVRSHAKTPSTRLQGYVGNSVSGSIPSLWMLETPTDYVVTGEGEWAALDIIRHLETDSPAEDILGITFRCNDGSVTENEKTSGCQSAGHSND